MGRHCLPTTKPPDGMRADRWAGCHRMMITLSADDWARLEAAAAASPPLPGIGDYRAKATPTSYARKIIRDWLDKHRCK